MSRWPLVLAVLVAGCDQGVEVVEADATVDSEVATDAAADASVAAEAARDTEPAPDATGTDVAADGADDALDATPGDGAVDAAAEVLSDSPAEVLPDAGTDVVADSSPEVPPDAAVAPTTLAALSAGLRDIAAGADSVFVTSFGGEIIRIPKDGGSPVHLASPEWPTYVAVDSSYVYWTDLRKLGGDPGKVGRVPIAGGAELLLATGLTRPNSCALSNGSVFFAQSDLVSKVPVGGGALGSVASSQDGAMYVATNSTTVCWVHSAALPSISCTPQAGGPVALVATETPAVTGGWTIRFLSVDASRAYWVMRDGSLRSVALSGGSPTTLAPALEECAWVADIDLDDTSVYWSCGPNIRKVPKAGGTATTLHHAATQTLGIAVDGTHVYWTTAAGNLVQKLPK